MAKSEALWDTRKGWIFCLNAPQGVVTGSHWGYVDDFLDDVKQEASVHKGIMKVYSPIWGKPYSKFAQLNSGDGVVFYHGKKARLTQRDTSRHVKPYQLTLAAAIDTVTQDPGTGEVTELTFSMPRDVYIAMSESPLKLDNTEVKEIVASSGLGGGRVGTFFPIDPPHWQKLLQLLKNNI
ncbi:MAG: hypothetical protein KDI17_07160 [Halioglobus sp.]|nr:hypothetical protein [Halioglobus sp.]